MCFIKRVTAAKKEVSKLNVDSSRRVDRLNYTSQVFIFYME